MRVMSKGVFVCFCVFLYVFGVRVCLFVCVFFCICL